MKLIKWLWYWWRYLEHKFVPFPYFDQLPEKPKWRN